MRRPAALVFAATLATAAGPAVTAGGPPAAQAHEPAARAHDLHDRTQERGRQRRDGGPEYTETVSRTLKIGAEGELDLSNISGDVVITGGGSDVRIQAVKRVRHASESEARRQLALVQVQITDRASRAEVRTLHPQGERRMHASVDYDVQVPPATRIRVKTISGDLSVKSVRGDLYVESISGDITVDATSRQATVKSVSGDVSIVAAGTGGDLRVSAISGTIRATSVKTSLLDVGTVSGDLVLTDVSCARANLRSVSGNVQYQGLIAPQGRYEMKSHSGDIRLTLGSDTGFELSATTFSGSIRSDLPVKLGGTGDDRRASRRQTLVGQYGDGSAVLDLTSFSGNITITKR